MCNIHPTIQYPQLALPSAKRNHYSHPEYQDGIGKEDKGIWESIRGKSRLQGEVIACDKKDQGRV